MSSTCPCCGTECHGALRPAASEATYLLCPTCGAGHLDPLPDDPRAWYTRDYFVAGGERAGYLDYEADERWHRITAAQRLRRLDRALAGRDVPRRLVDVGAATGFLMDVARERGWEPVGVEASQWAADRARSRGHEVVDDLADVQGPVGAVLFCQVLEHLPDPVGALQRAAGLLAPGGVVLCETWDLASRTARWTGSHWQQLSPPSVLWLFTEDGMGALAAQAGLEPVSWRRSPKLVPVSTVLGQSVGSLNHGRAAGVLRAIGQNLAVPYPLDDLVTATLRKPA